MLPFLIIAHYVNAGELSGVNAISSFSGIHDALPHDGVDRLAPILGPLSLMDSSCSSSPVLWHPQPRLPGTTIPS